MKELHQKAEQYDKDIIRCPECNSADTVKVDKELPPSKFQVRCCKDCDHRFVHPNPVFDS